MPLLGQTVIHKIARAEGVVVARTEFYSGEVRFGIQPSRTTSDGRPAECWWAGGNELETIDPVTGNLIE